MAGLMVSSNSASNVYAGGLRATRVQDSYHYGLSSADQLSLLGRVTAIRSPLLSSNTFNLLNTEALNARYGNSASVRLSNQGQRQSALADFRASLEKLAKPEQRAPILSSSSNDKVATAVVSNAGKLPQNMTLTINQIAKAQQVQTAEQVVPDTLLGGGTLIFQFGLMGDGGGLSSGGRETRLTIMSSASSLIGIANAINQRPDLGLKAEVLTTENGRRLRLTGLETGGQQAFSVTVGDLDGNNADQAGLSRLAYDPATGRNLQSLETAQDASLVLDGRAQISASNTLQLDGSTLTLREAGTTELSFSRDQEALKTSAKQVADALNKTFKQLADLDDGQTRQAVARLQGVVSDAAAGSGLMRLSLEDIGIGADKNGRYLVDAPRLADAVKNKTEGVADLLGIAVGALSQQVSSILASTSGLQASMQLLREQFSASQTQPSNTFSVKQGGYSVSYGALRNMQQYWVVSML